MFRHFFPLALLSALFLGGFFVLANTPWLVNSYGPQWIEEQFSDLKVGTFHVDRQRYSWPDQLFLSGVQAQIRYREQDVGVEAQDVMIKGTVKSIKEQDPIKVSIREGKLTTADLQMSQFQLDLNIPAESLKNKVLAAKGMLRTERFQFRHYEAESVLVRFGVTPDQLQIVEASANLYGGKFQSGQVSFQFRPGALYLSWSELTGLNANLLGKLNPIIFSGLTGRMNGTCRLVGDVSKIEVLAIILNMTEGGILSADLLNRLWPYLHDTVYRTKIQSLAQQNQPFTFDDGTLYIQNIDPLTVALVIGIENKSQDIHIQERILVPIKEGLREFLLHKPQ